MNGYIESGSRTRRPRRLAPSAADHREPRSLREAAGLAGCLVAPTLAVAALGRVGVAGVGLLVVCKLAAVAALGAGRGGRPDATAADRAALAEAVTLGALVAFVASLAIGNLVPMPRSMVLLDWVASLGTLAAVRRVIDRRAAKGAAAEVRLDPDSDSEPEPEVVATFRGRVVMVALPAGHLDTSGLLGRIAALKPARWIVVGGDPEQVDRLGPCVSRLAADASASALREAFAAYRPAVLIDAYEPEFGGESVRAITTRRLVNAALGAGVPSVVLISRGADPGDAASSPSLSERIMRALAGLTRSRLIRVRFRDGISLADPATARRVLRIAAKGRDGSLVKLGPSVGSCEEVLGGRGDAAELWAELNQIEVVQGWR
jgi:hypothetical protein